MKNQTFYLIITSLIFMQNLHTEEETIAEQPFDAFSHADSIESLQSTNKTKSKIEKQRIIDHSQRNQNNNGAKTVASDDHTAKIDLDANKDQQAKATDSMQKVQEALEKLPKKNKPKDMSQALKFIKKGEVVWKSLEEGKFFDAVEQNMRYKGINLNNEQDPHMTTLQRAFNSDNKTFWEQIKDNKLLEEKAKRHDIPFTYESFSLPENNMYFRSTYARKSISDFALLNEYQHAYEAAIVQVQWHLYAHAIQQDFAFTSGMITLKDPDYKLFRFMDGYAELVSPKYKLHSGMSLHSLFETKAYTRESSHWSGQKAFNDKNFGIDIQGDSNKPLDILPGNKSHLLFGMRTNDMVFVKWEEYGTTFNVVEGDYSAITHTLRYFQKKDKQDDPSLHRREVTSNDVMQKFKNSYKKPLSKEQEEKIKKYGISEMLKMLQSSPDRQKAFKKYLTDTKGYQKETLNQRKGGEVILNRNSIS